MTPIGGPGLEPRWPTLWFYLTAHQSERNASGSSVLCRYQVLRVRWPQRRLDPEAAQTCRELGGSGARQRRRRGSRKIEIKLLHHLDEHGATIPDLQIQAVAIQQAHTHQRGGVSHIDPDAFPAAIPPHSVQPHRYTQAAWLHRCQDPVAVRALLRPDMGLPALRRWAGVGAALRGVPRRVRILLGRLADMF